MIVGIIYTIPIILILAIVYGSLFLAVSSGSNGHMDSAIVPGWKPNTGFVLLMYLVEIIVGLILPVASIRFARTNSFSEAFNVGAILGYIGKIGWITYIIALVLVALIIGIPICILLLGFILLGGVIIFIFRLSNIAILGFIFALVLIILVLSPLFAVFQARYMTRVYDSAVPEV
jgi:hypothetical protein